MAYELKEIPFGTTDFKTAKDRMKKKIKNRMKYSNGFDKVVKNSNKWSAYFEGHDSQWRRSSKKRVIIPKDVYARLKSQSKIVL